MNRLQELANIKEDYSPIGNIPKEQIMAAFKTARDKYMGAKPYDDSFREEGKKALETMKKHGIVSYNDIRGYELLTYKLEELSPSPVAATAPEKVQGSINLVLLKQLDPNLNPASISTTIGKVKNGSALNMNDNKILSGLMTSLIKTSDDVLLSKIFANLKQIQAN
jgi:hypothetical protein